MKRFDDSRDELMHLQGNLSPSAYLEHIWTERYPKPAPAASAAWPFVKPVLPANVISMSKVEGKQHGRSNGSQRQT